MGTTSWAVDLFVVKDLRVRILKPSKPTPFSYGRTSENAL